MKSRELKEKSPIYPLRLPCYRTMEEGKKLSVYPALYKITGTQLPKVQAKTLAELSSKGM